MKKLISIIVLMCISTFVFASGLVVEGRNIKGDQQYTGTMQVFEVDQQDWTSGDVVATNNKTGKTLKLRVFRIRHNIYDFTNDRWLGTDKNDNQYVFGLKWTNGENR